MSLEEKLADLRARSAKRHLPERAATMRRATEDLRNSGILDGVIKVGEKLPPLALPNQDGVEMRSDDLLKRGPLVVTVFRGAW